MRPAGWALVWCLAGAGAVAAQEKREPTLEQASRLFSEGEFEAALAVLQTLAGKPLGDDVLAQVHVLRAQVLAGMKRPDASAAALVDALGHDPELSVDPARVQPSLMTQLESLRRDLRGELVMRGPPDAQLFLDDVALEGTSVRRQVAIGRHELRAQMPSGQVVTRSVVVGPDRTHEVVFVADGTPDIRANVPEAAVGTTPVAPADPLAAEQPPVQGHQLLLEARANLDLPRGVAVEVGAGWSHAPVFATASATLGARPGVTARVGIESRRLLGPVGPYLSVDGVLFFGADPLVGAGAAVGAQVAITRVFEAFTEVAFRRLAAPEGIRSDYVLWGLGLRARL